MKNRLLLPLSLILLSTGFANEAGYSPAVEEENAFVDAEVAITEDSAAPRARRQLRAPRAEGETQQAAEAPRARPQSQAATPQMAPRRQQEQSASAETPRARPQAQATPRRQEQGATAESHSERQQAPRQAPQAQPSPARPQSQGAQGQRKAPSYDRNGVYAPPSQSSLQRPAQRPVAQMNDDSQDQMYSSPDQMQGQQQGMQQRQNGNGMMANAPTQPMVKNGFDVYLRGDALLWQAVEENLTYVYSQDTDESGTNRDLHTVDFRWDWGFRLAAGYNTPRDGWDLALMWTHIRNIGHDKQHSGSDDELFQVWTIQDRVIPGTINSAKARWQVNLEQVDLDLGRQFHVSKCFCLRPFVGMRSTWLYQKYDVDVTSDTNKQDADLRNRFWGFGFTAGLDSDWKLGWGMSLYGEADASILLGFFDVTQKGSQDDATIWAQDKSFRTGRAIMDLGLGLKWNRLFYGDSLGLTLKAGYEYHMYFDQNQFMFTNGSSTLELFNPVHGDLTYQGVMGSIQLDF